MRIFAAALFSLLIFAPIASNQANGFGLFPTGGVAPDTCSLSQPAVAAANGMNTQELCEDFTSGASTDGYGTLGPNYNWYTKAVSGSGSPVTFVAPTDFTVGSSILNLNSEQVAGGFAFMSSTTTGYSPTVTTVGAAYTPPFYMEFKIAVNQSLAPGSLGSGDCGSGVVSRYSWPTIWLNDMTLNIAQFSGGSVPLTSNKAEVDILEFYVGCNGMGSGVWSPESSIHIWNTATTILTSNSNNVRWGSGQWDGVTYHTVGELITSSNAYTYFDGTLEQTINLSGDFAPAATGNYNIIMNPGVLWPMHVDYVQVWH